MGSGKLKIAVLGSTRGTDLQAIIDAVEKKELMAEIALVASDRKGAHILQRAEKHGIKSVFLDYAKHSSRAETEKEMVKMLREEKAELVLLIGFMKILSPYFTREFRGRIWNIHPSLLPKYAGGMDGSVHRKVIENKEKETGCTLHEVTETVDAGRVIMQKKIAVSPGETPETLKEKVQKLEQECLLESIKKVINGELVIGEPN